MRFQISMILAILVGLAYVVWLAWAEGWRLWVVLGVMVLIAVIGGAVHLAMGLARARDGLDRGTAVAVAPVSKAPVGEVPVGEPEELAEPRPRSGEPDGKDEGKG